jgi:hypothetical protein
MSHNEFKISEPMAPQETGPMKPAMSVLGIDIGKRVFHAVSVDEGNAIQVMLAGYRCFATCCV